MQRAPCRPASVIEPNADLSGEGDAADPNNPPT
jgi:hypothetical protein